MCVDIMETRRAVTVKSHHDKTFTFDGTFGKDSTQIDVYRSVVQPLISEVLQGYNCTVFAYGQTGTGKTYTMEGVRSEQLLSWQHDPHAGIVPRALHQIFSEVGDPGLTIIKVSFLELYNEELFDLLGSGDHNAKLKIFEDSSAKGSVVVRGLEEVIVRDRQEVYSLMERGASRRQVAATLMNASSSRSHTIFTITVISKDTTDTGEGLMRTGKLNLVDLAGSENIGRSGAQDKRAREAGNINQSLLTLGRVITALVERTPHVPYRESKLTRLLQDSLGGRTKTSIIATISPAQVNLEESLSTLEYAFRAKNITNRPEVNQKLCKEVVLKHMTDELEQLRRDLIACREKNGFYIDETNYREMQNRLDLQSEELQKKAQEMTDMAERIDLLKTQIEEITRVFENTQKCLEVKTQEMHRVQNRLKEVNYNYTGAKVMIKAHKMTEEKLHEDARKMMQSLKMASTDATLLHEKVQRQQEVAENNSSVVEKLMG
ncbi:kinesin protein KIF11, partial [Tropilaelaps mercedesae]